MSSVPLTLLTLPDVAMKHILRECDYASKQVLRKTCWDLRRFLDDVKIDSRVEDVSLTVGCFEISFVASWNPSETIHLNYCTHDTSSNEWRKDDKMNSYTFRSGNFQKQFWRDFELFLMQHSKIESLYLQLDLTVGPEEVDDILFRRIKAILGKSIIEVENLDVNIRNQNNLMNILPFVKEKSLKSIFVSDDRQKRLLELDEVVVLDQWKYAEKLSIWCYVNAKIQDFAHFSDVTIHYEKFNVQDVGEIRKAFSENPKLIDFRLYYSDSGTEDVVTQTAKTLTNQFGEPDSDEIWYFKIRNSDEFLTLWFTTGIIFQRTDKKEIPAGVIVLE